MPSWKLVLTVTVIALTLGVAGMAPAAAAKHRVALDPPPKAEIGQAFEVTGTVPTAKKGARVLLQRRLPGSSFRTVARSTVRSSHSFALRFTTSRPGPASYRVVAPRSKGRSQGVSATVTIEAHRWRSALEMPVTTINGGFTTDASTIAVNGLRRSSGWATTGESTVRLDLAGHRCWKLRGLFGIDDSSSTGAGSALVYRGSDFEVNGAVHGLARGNDPFDIELTLHDGQADVVITTQLTSGGSGVRPAVLAPELLCAD